MRSGNLGLSWGEKKTWDGFIEEILVGRYHCKIWKCSVCWLELGQGNVRRPQHVLFFNHVSACSDVVEDQAKSFVPEQLHQVLILLDVHPSPYNESVLDDTYFI